MTIQEYDEVTVIINGALDEERIFPATVEGHNESSGWLEFRFNLAEVSGQHTQIFIQHHPHPLSPECECAQYETDHHPAFDLNPPTEGE